MDQRLTWISTLLLLGCTIPPDRGERIRLDWVEKVDARSLFDSDREEGNYRFFSVMGYSEDIPALGIIEYQVCFYPYAELARFNGPGDVIGDAEHARLGGLVTEFAQEYNRSMQAHLAATGRTRCDPETDLDGVWAELSGLVGAPPNHVSFTQGFLWLSPTFWMRVESGQLQDTPARACEVLERNHALNILDIVIERGEDSVTVDCLERPLSRADGQ